MEVELAAVTSAGELQAGLVADFAGVDDLHVNNTKRRVRWRLCLADIDHPTISNPQPSGIRQVEDARIEECRPHVVIGVIPPGIDRKHVLARWHGFKLEATIITYKRSNIVYVPVRHERRGLRVAVSAVARRGGCGHCERDRQAHDAASGIGDRSAMPQEATDYLAITPSGKTVIRVVSFDRSSVVV